MSKEKVPHSHHARHSKCPHLMIDDRRWRVEAPDVMERERPTLKVGRWESTSHHRPVFGTLLEHYEDRGA